MIWFDVYVVGLCDGECVGWVVIGFILWWIEWFNCRIGGVFGFIVNVVKYLVLWVGIGVFVGRVVVGLLWYV